MARNLLKRVPSKEAQRVGYLNDEQQRLADVESDRRPWWPRESEFASIVGSDPEIVAVRSQLRVWILAKKHEQLRRGRRANFEILDRAAALLDAHGVGLKLGYSSKATKLLQSKLKVSPHGARDMVQRLVNISQRIGA